MYGLVYDIEIAKRVKKDPDRSKGELGWDDARAGRCGVSSVVIYDTISTRFHVYDGIHTITQCMEHLNSADFVIGFNNIEFDGPCLEGYTKQPLLTRQIDIRQGVLAVLKKPFMKGYKLGQLCERTLGISKSGDGESAPDLYQQGRFAELIDYNINDVHITRLLHNYIVDNGHVIGVDGEILEIPNYFGVKV